MDRNKTETTLKHN